MKKKLFCILLSIFVVFQVSAQQKQLTINDAVIGQWQQLYPEQMYQLQWKNSSNVYTYVENKTYSTLFAVEAKSGTEKQLTTLKEFNKSLKDINLQEQQYLSKHKWINDNTLRLHLKYSLVYYNTKTKKSELKISYDKNAKHVTFNSTDNAVAYTIDNNLFYSDSKNNVKQITNDTDKGIVNGSDYVHRQEFGINKGIFWSPDNEKIAFYRKDETMVTDYPIVNITTRIAENEPIKYPMAGEKSEEVTLGIYDIKTGKTIYIKTGAPKEQYLTVVTWDPNSIYIYIGVLNRGQNHLKLNKYDVKTGDLVKTLFEEKHDNYVEPEHQLIFLKSNPEKFLWYSERDNYNHLYLYNTDGKLINQVTKGDWVVTDYLGEDKSGKYIYIEATAKSAIERHAYKVQLKNGKMTQITQEDGTHNVQVSYDGTFFIDQYTNTETPNVIQLLDKKGNKQREILKSDNPLSSYELPDMELGTIKSADKKTDLHYRLITPKNLDRNKKYPVLVYVYGGPHAQLVNNRWLGGSRLWEYYMAQKGYIVFVLDNRGSANRGLEFENVIHRNLGENEMADQMQGIEFLKSLGYADMDKVGVHGWSYGGFMTISLMTTYPDIFKVGVAGGPVIDWKYYEVMYGERYMDTPQENPKGYEKANLLNKAKKLEGKLLIIHGCIDPVVVWQHSLAFINQCIADEVLLDYFVYPRHEHNVRGKDRVHLMRKVTQYFDDYLK